MSPNEIERMASILENGKMISCGAYLIVPHHSGLDKSYSVIQPDTGKVAAYRNVKDVTWLLQDKVDFEVVNGFDIAKAIRIKVDNHTKYGRDEFMEFFRSDDFSDQMSADDCTEVFSQVLHGGSDFTKELLVSTTSDYDVDINAVLGFDDYEMIAEENKRFGQFLGNLGYTEQQISDIANSGKILDSSSGTLGEAVSELSKNTQITEVVANNFVHKKVFWGSVDVNGCDAGVIYVCAGSPEEADSIIKENIDDRVTYVGELSEKNSNKYWPSETYLILGESDGLLFPVDEEAEEEAQRTAELAWKNEQMQKIHEAAEAETMNHYYPNQIDDLAKILVNTRDFCGDELEVARQYCTDQKLDINSGIYREALIEADNIWDKAHINAGAIKSIASGAPKGSLEDAASAVSKSLAQNLKQ